MCLSVFEYDKAAEPNRIYKNSATFPVVNLYENGNDFKNVHPVHLSFFCIAAFMKLELALHM